MKISFLESMSESYAKNDPLWKRFYPRRIVSPLDFYSPKYYAIIACAQHENPMTPLEQRAVAMNNAIDGMPTYFLDGNFMQAILETVPKERPPLADIHLPLSSMLLMLPDSVARRYFFGFKAPCIAYTLCPVKDYPNKRTFVFHVVLVPEDGKPLGYYGRVPCDDVVGDSLTSYQYNDHTEAETAYINWCLEGRPNPDIHDVNCRLPSPEEDKMMPDKAFSLLYRLFMVLQSADIKKYLSPGQETRREIGHPGSKKHKEALWSPAFIGKGYKPKHESSGGHHLSPRLHWRRGHMRNQSYGPNNSLRKIIWIEPILVGS